MLTLFTHADIPAPSTAGNYDDAINKYCKAAEYLLTALKYEKNPVTLKTIREKCIEYTSRAETLKKGLDNPKGGKPQRGGGANEADEKDDASDDEGPEPEPLTEEQLATAEAEMEEEMSKYVRPSRHLHIPPSTCQDTSTSHLLLAKTLAHPTFYLHRHRHLLHLHHLLLHRHRHLTNRHRRVTLPPSSLCPCAARAPPSPNIAWRPQPRLSLGPPASVCCSQAHRYGFGQEGHAQAVQAGARPPLPHPQCWRAMLASGAGERCWRSSDGKRCW